MAEMATKKPDELYGELASIVSQNIPNFQEALLKKAFEFACRCHGDQKRYSGEPM